MRTQELWNEKIRSKIIANRFPPRIQQDLERIKIQIDTLPEGGLFLYSETNTGKTIYACSLLLEKERQMYLTGQPGQCLFISNPELIQELQATMRPDHPITAKEILDAYKAAPLLVLDDVGAEKPSEWVIQTLYLLLNYRYEHMLPTIITSNLPMEKIEQNYSSRISSRIERMCVSAKKKHWKI